MRQDHTKRMLCTSPDKISKQIPPIAISVCKHLIPHSQCFLELLFNIVHIFLYDSTVVSDCRSMSVRP